MEMNNNEDNKKNAISNINDSEDCDESTTIYNRKNSNDESEELTKSVKTVNIITYNINTVKAYLFQCYIKRIFYKQLIYELLRISKNKEKIIYNKHLDKKDKLYKMIIHNYSLLNENFINEMHRLNKIMYKKNYNNFTKLYILLICIFNKIKKYNINNELVIHILKNIFYLKIKGIAYTKYYKADKKLGLEVKNKSLLYETVHDKLLKEIEDINAKKEICKNCVNISVDYKNLPKLDSNKKDDNIDNEDDEDDFDDEEPDEGYINYLNDQISDLNKQIDSQNKEKNKEINDLENLIKTVTKEIVTYNVNK